MFAAWLGLVRPLNCILAGVAVIIGALVGAGTKNMAGGEVYIFAFIVAALVAAGGNAINDYFDREIDKINRPKRPIPSGKIKPETALATGQGFFILGIIFSLILKNVYCFGLAGLNSLMLALYAGKLKNSGLPGNLTIGYLVGSTFLFGGIAVAPYGLGPLVSTELWVLILMAALSTIGRELIKGIEDVPGDKKLKLRTFPLAHGKKKAAWVAVGFILTAVIISPIPYIWGVFGWVYLAPLLVAISSFLLASGLILWKQDTKVSGWASLSCKAGMGFGLVAFLAGILSV